MQLFATLRNAWRIKDIRRKLLFTWPCCWSTGWVPLSPFPALTLKSSPKFSRAAGGGLFGLFDVFAGGALSEFSIFAMGVFPILTPHNYAAELAPSLRRWARKGRGLINGPDYPLRCRRAALDSVHRYGLCVPLGHYLPGAASGAKCTLSLIVIIFSLTAGAAFLMWLGELITDKGIATAAP